MSAFSWFKDRFRREDEHYIYAPIAPANVRFQDGSAADDHALAAGQDYFRIWLVEMFLKNDRDWFSAWYPAVLSAVSFKFGGNPQVVSNVISQAKQKDLLPKDLEKSDLNKFLTMNREMTGLLAFNDGTVTVDAALVAMQGNNDIKGLIKALGSFGSILALPQLSAALKIADPLVDAIGSLVGATNSAFMTGMSQTFSEKGGGGDAVFRAGYYAMLDAKESELSRDKLWVINDRLQYGDSADVSKQLTGYNYILVRIEHRETRDDWDSLTSIQTPYQNALNALQTGSLEQAQVHLKTAIAGALVAPELTKKVDRRRVVEALRARFEEDKKNMGAGAFARRDASLQNLMNNAGEVKSAARKPLIRPDEAFGGLP
jgi:hypothetical protein